MRRLPRAVGHPLEVLHRVGDVRVAAVEPRALERASRAAGPTGRRTDAPRDPPDRPAARRRTSASPCARLRRTPSACRPSRGDSRGTRPPRAAAPAASPRAAGSRRRCRSSSARFARVVIAVSRQRAMICSRIASGSAPCAAAREPRVTHKRRVGHPHPSGRSHHASPPSAPRVRRGRARRRSSPVASSRCSTGSDGDPGSGARRDDDAARAARNRHGGGRAVHADGEAHGGHARTRLPATRIARYTVDLGPNSAPTRADALAARRDGATLRQGCSRSRCGTDTTPRPSSAIAARATRRRRSPCVARCCRPFRIRTVSGSWRSRE